MCKALSSIPSTDNKQIKNLNILQIRKQARKEGLAHFSLAGCKQTYNGLELAWEPLLPLSTPKIDGLV